MPIPNKHITFFSFQWKFSPIRTCEFIGFLHGRQYSCLWTKCGQQTKVYNCWLPANNSNKNNNRNWSEAGEIIDGNIKWGNRKPTSSIMRKKCLQFDGIQNWRVLYHQNKPLKLWLAHTNYFAEHLVCISIVAHTLYVHIGHPLGGYIIWTREHWTNSWFFLENWIFSRSISAQKAFHIPYFFLSARNFIHLDGRLIFHVHGGLGAVVVKYNERTSKWTVLYMSFTEWWRLSFSFLFVVFLFFPSGYYKPTPLAHFVHFI